LVFEEKNQTLVLEKSLRNWGCGFAVCREEKMPLKVLEATVSSFDGVFEKFRSEAAENKANLILFLADKDPATSLSWCPGIYPSFYPCMPFFFFLLQHVQI